MLCVCVCVCVCILVSSLPPEAEMSRKRQEEGDHVRGAQPDDKACISSVCCAIFRNRIDERRGWSVGQSVGRLVGWLQLVVDATLAHILYYVFMTAAHTDGLGWVDGSRTE